MIKIIAETTACLNTQFAREHDIVIIPQVINFGNQSFLEGVDLDIAAFMQRLTNSPELPKTAAPPPELFCASSSAAPLGGTIICLLPSAEVSGTVRSALVAAHEYPDADIRVVDTRVTASPLGTMIELAAGWVEDGRPADEIVSNILDLSQRCRLYFIVDTLEYLARGGRIGGAAALLGGMLQIKPILRLNDGKVDQYERERTHRRAVIRLKEIVVEQCPESGDGHLTVVYSGDKAEGQALAADLAKQFNLPGIPVIHLPPAVVAHGGPGILGAGFFIEPARP